ALGLTFQPRPPYYLLRTPTLDRQDLFGLMQEAQDVFGVEFDAQPPPVLDLPEAADLAPIWRVDLDRPSPPAPAPAGRAQAFTLGLRAADFDVRRREAAALVRRLLDDNPFTTLQVVLDATDQRTPAALSPRTLEALTAACQDHPTYLDRYYALQPGR